MFGCLTRSMVQLFVTNGCNSGTASGDRIVYRRCFNLKKHCNAAREFSRPFESTDLWPPCSRPPGGHLGVEGGHDGSVQAFRLLAVTEHSAIGHHVRVTVRLALRYDEGILGYIYQHRVSNENCRNCLAAMHSHPPCRGLVAGCGQCQEEGNVFKDRSPEVVRVKKVRPGDIVTVRLMPGPLKVTSVREDVFEAEYDGHVFRFLLSEAQTP